MSATLTPLICDFLAWLAEAPRDYAEVMERWRTSCPRLTVWEDAVDGGLVEVCTLEGAMKVRVTKAGLGFLQRTRM